LTELCFVFFYSKGKPFAIEEGPSSIQISHANGTRRATNYFKLFKWFVAINILILLLFCGYALWNLYQLENALQAREDAINLNRYFDRYDPNSIKKTTTIGDINVADFDSSVIISDFHEWQQSILSNLENLQDDVSYNLKFLLHTITSIVKNFANNDKARTIGRVLVVQNITNSSMPNGKLITANLTDFEIHILKEFINLTMLENKGMRRSRFTRAPRNNNIETACNFQLSFDAKDEKLISLSIKSDEKDMPIGINNDISNLSKNDNKDDLRKCIINILYKPFNRL
ncbi:PREDICTED: uncharacterized protein LOC105368364, partial [Ceratosolen solmsi marchali]|uniref:Uncharacterized protein LOC105368364 n=1 Tax=Ceratosolen solmsi marchali TaxID=326594 RepID=A0AAJ6YWI4_9HYME